jgi:aminopeptidase N
LTVRQVQDTSKGTPIYKIPVIVGIHTNEGNVSKKVWIEKDEEIFEFSAKEKPLMVRFDEGNYLLKEWTFKKKVDELLYQLKNDDVIGRGWAARELSEHSDEADVVKALNDSAQNDEFWAVRQEAILALGKMKREEDIDLFKEKTEDEKSHVRSTALQVLGEFGRADLVPFFTDRFEKEDSYLAQAEALRSIGKCGNQTHLPFLEEAAKMKSYRNVIERAAESAIKTIKQRNH